MRTYRVRTDADIQHPYHVTFGVVESRRLHRLPHTERALARASAGWFFCARNFEVRQALARRLWRDAERMWRTYEGMKELRGNVARRNRRPDQQLNDALFGILYAPDEVGYRAGVFRVVKPVIDIRLHRKC